MLKIIVCILLTVFIISSCNHAPDHESRKLLKEYLNKKPVYLVKTGNFESKEKAISTVVQLQKLVNCNIYIQKNSSKDSLNYFEIELGKFKSSFDAGKLAYKLFSHGDIKEYQIIRNGNKVFDNFADILFVGKTGNTTGVYKGNIFSGKPEKIWSKPNEIVADLDYSQNLSKAYFITVTGTGYIGIFPYIKKAKLYLVDILQNKVQLIKEFGDGIQIFSHWEPQDFYKVVLLSFDKSNPIRVVEQTMILNGTGVPVNEENRIINLDKENYPQIPGPDINKVSPDGKYKLLSLQTKKNFQIFLLDNNKQEKKIIMNTNKELSESGWTEDNQNLIFSTTNIFNRISGSYKNGFSELNIYNLANNKINTIGGREGIKNFLIRGDLIIFDDGFDKKSIIQVFDINKNKFINKISIKGGCGINNIPTLPGNK